MREKGFFFWKERWYSFCSAHREYDKDCPRCKAGSWKNVWMVAINGFLHDNCYKYWHWRVNR